MNEATHAVLAAGYRSVSPDFCKIVNIMLSRNSRFERVARGHYTCEVHEVYGEVRVPR